VNVVLAAFDPVPAAKGASAHVLANVRALQRDHEVSLVTLGDAPAPGLRHRVVRPEGANWLRRATDFHRRCKPILAGFDVVHARSPFEGLAAAEGSLRVAEVNALYSVELPYHYPALTDHPGFRGPMRALEVTWLERADVIVTPSAVTAAYLDDLGFPDARVVPNAPSVPRPAQIAAPRPPGAGPLRLVYVGTLTAWQGLATAIEVLPRLLDLDPVLTVYTASSRRKWVEKLAAKRGVGDRVHLRDALPPTALGAALGEHDLALAPLTPSERNLVQGCMPIKVLDYLRAGVAVVAPELPVVRAMVGPGAPLYRPWSRQSLVDTIRDLATSDRAALVQAGRERVEAVFSERAQAEALRAVYRELAP
jgi:glycosyltransferase involved in cell wall biosynthesis